MNGTFCVRYRAEAICNDRKSLSMPAGGLGRGGGGAVSVPVGPGGEAHGSS